MVKIANQDTERITRTAEAALVKKALAGDTTALTQLLKRSHASSAAVIEPVDVPQVFKGKKQLAFEAIIQGHTGRSAAEISGLNECTISRYRSDEAWLAALESVKVQRVAMAARGLNDLLPLSIKRIRTVLSDPSASHRDVLRAAEMVMDRAGIPKAERVEVSGSVETPGSLTVNPSDELARLLAGGGVE